jgi:hypothetical protein
LAAFSLTSSFPYGSTSKRSLPALEWQANGLKVAGSREAHGEKVKPVGAGGLEESWGSVTACSTLTFQARTTELRKQLTFDLERGQNLSIDTQDSALVIPSHNLVSPKNQFSLARAAYGWHAKENSHQ